MKIPSAKPYFLPSDISTILSNINEILLTGRLTNGEYLKKFESAFARYIGTKYAIATNSGTSSLEILMRYYGVKGKEVIIPTNTFIATCSAVILSGGTPILVDINPDDLCFNIGDIENQISSKTIGIIAVHIGGRISNDINGLRDICAENDLFLVEDAAHAHGATINGNKAGSLGDGGSFSFFPTKVMTTGEGGMITTNDLNLFHYANSVRNHGSSNIGNYIDKLGNNWRMSEIHSTLGLSQLNRIDEMIEKRNSIANLYQSGLRDLKTVNTLEIESNSRCSYYKYPMILQSVKLKDLLSNKLKEKFGIETGSLYWPPCHMQPLIRMLYPNKSRSLVISEDILERTLALPIYPSMTSNEVSYVVSSINQILTDFGYD